MLCLELLLLELQLDLGLLELHDCAHGLCLLILTQQLVSLPVEGSDAVGRVDKLPPLRLI